jgi:spore coat protein JB
MEITEKALLKQISEMQFAFYECLLYLDTHPKDKDALKKFEHYRVKLSELMALYESRFGPITMTGDFGNDGFDWVSDPWPWEKEAN